MNSSTSKLEWFGNLTTIKILLATIFVTACTLSIKAALDLAENSVMFPEWFVPGFVLAIFILITLSMYFVFRVWKIGKITYLLTSSQSVALWIFMLLSFICTTSVHGFYPFHSPIFSMAFETDPILKINYRIALLGFTTCVILAGIYLFSPLKVPATIGLLTAALLMLIPNDNCANPFNYWWIKTLGASPLMYVPNMYMVLFVASGLCNVHPKTVTIITIGICLASLMLGLGHQLGIIW